MHIYESHLGGLYALKDFRETEVCEQCFDEDEYIGEFESVESLKQHLISLYNPKEDYSEEAPYCPYSDSHLHELFEE